MLKTKLILICGMSGAGKSTTAQQMAKQYQLNNVPYLWLHEEIDNHPIRDNEFNVASRDTVEGMDINAADMYLRWERLAEEICQSDRVYIMEGCLYQNIIRYFLGCHYPLEKITQFYDRIMAILAKVNPTIVFLYREDVKASFQQAFAVRGQRWQNIILDPEGEGYFTKHKYQGDESIYAIWEEYQTIAQQMFDRCHNRKLRLVTSDGQWQKHIQTLTEYVGLDYKHPAGAELLTDPASYCGRYQIQLADYTAQLLVKMVEGALYCQVSFWENMKLLPIGPHQFEIQSFPVTFTFDLEQGSVTVGGNYGWEITGKTLYRVEDQGQSEKLND